MSATGITSRGVARVPLADQLRDLADHRDLLSLLVRKELKVKYRGTMLGMLWSLFNPLLLMAVYTAVFSVITRFPMPNYPIFLLAALLPWTAFAASLSSSVRSIVGHGNLVRRIRFPVAVLPTSMVIANVVNLLPGFAILLVFALFSRQPLGLPLVGLPLLVVLQLMFTLGVALVLSALNVYFRDLEYLVGVALMVWFFGTPVLYPLSAFAGKPVGVLIKLNPMTWLIDSYQRIWHANQWPDGRYLLGFAAAACLTLVIGGLVFGRASRRFAEEV